MKSKKTNAERQVVSHTVQPVVGRFVVIQSEDLKDPMTEIPESAQIEGTFDTMARCEQFIRADTHEWFTPDGGYHEGRNDDHTAPIYICQVVRIVKAVPIMNLRVTIEDAVPTPNPKAQGTGGIQ